MKKSKGRSATAISLASEMIWRNPRDPSPSVAGRTPNVRELWIHNFCTQLQASDVPEAGFWPKAEYLYCRDVVRNDRTSRGLPVFGISEHVTEVFIDRCELDLFFGDKELYEASYDGELAKLKSLSLTNILGAARETLERIIRPSLEGGKLEALQLNPYPFKLLPASHPRVGDNDWLRNKCVKHLTVGGFNLLHGLIDPDAALTAIVGQCGALESLDIGQEAVQAATLVAFIKKKENEKARDGGRVRALYHDNPELPTYDLQAWVREKDLGEVHRRPYPGSSEELWRNLSDR
ncbi:hypothetical protein PG999_004883 [Apiospora kogelbergensis]|uniref:Uncharacterized protein n=2 Tax=Apiospora kogelbergensis TaxID=1337665 RepID=A0AAW0R0L4_9PEZI